MKLYIENHPYHYELENLIKAFFANEKIEITYDPKDLGEFYIYTAKKDFDDTIELYLKYKHASSELSDSVVISKKEQHDYEYHFALMIFSMLTKVTGKKLKWGILTGIRPVKLFRSVCEKLGEEKTLEHFRNNLKVSEEKTELALNIAKRQKAIIENSDERSFSLYVSVPFCPSRCNYCSFISQSIEGSKKLIPEYLKLLCEELKATAFIANELKLKLKSIYIGGGTPTTFSAYELSKLFETINNCFDCNKCLEFTVEAGRPDTVTSDKLQAILDAKATRISINPQTMNDDVLNNIGRKHSSRQTIEAFELARNMGFDNINMDLIAGLSGDTLESFSNTLQSVIKLSPENITLHTLSLKRSSQLNIDGKLLSLEENSLAENMIKLAYTVFSENHYVPYYLYRQRKMLDNLENTGFCKESYECVYNVFMMDEVHTVLSCGAGAVSKLLNPFTGKIERIFNFKYPYEYISRFSELIERKQKVGEFYAKFGVES